MEISTNKNQKGLSLIEVLIAMAIISVVMISVVSLGSLSIRASIFARTQTTATRFSQQASEWLYGEKSANFTNFRSLVTASRVYCFTSLNWSNPGACGGSQIIPGTIFTRSTTFTLNLDGSITADTITSWIDGQGTHNATISNIYGDIK